MTQFFHMYYIFEVLVFIYIEVVVAAQEYRWLGINYMVIISFSWNPFFKLCQITGVVVVRYLLRYQVLEFNTIFVACQMRTEIMYLFVI